MGGVARAILAGPASETGQGHGGGRYRASHDGADDARGAASRTVPAGPRLRCDATQVLTQYRRYPVTYRLVGRLDGRMECG